jgi:acyl-CoA thioester hydrolase
MAHVHRSHFSSRSYEMDSYRHLNNGVYVSWYEQARLEYLQSLGFSYDGFADREQYIVVVRTEVDFRLPVLAGEALEIETTVESFGRTSLRWRQVMRRGPDEVVSEARTVMVFADGDNRPIAIPQDFRDAVGVPAEG